jgi:addiction module HigA family antidote
MVFELAVHPGEMLREEFLAPLQMSAYRLAREIRVSQTRIGEILREERGISAETAMRLGRFFGMTPQFWLNLQNNWDLQNQPARIAKEIAKIKPLKKARAAVTRPADPKAARAKATKPSPKRRSR